MKILKKDYFLQDKKISTEKTHVMYKLTQKIAYSTADFQRKAFKFHYICSP